MPDVVVLLLAASATTVATGLGAIPVFYLGDRAEQLTPPLIGFAAGVMGVASIVGLLIPAAEEGSLLDLLVGLAAGAALLGVARRRLDPKQGFMGRQGPGARTSALVFLVLFAHSLPEGFAIGTAFASDRSGLSLFVIVAIAIQNIPEGTSVAIPMAAAGFSRSRQFWAAVGTSLPQPVGALVAFLLVKRSARCCRSRSPSQRARCSRWSHSSCFPRPIPTTRGSARAPASCSAPRSCSR